MTPNIFRVFAAEISKVAKTEKHVFAPLAAAVAKRLEQADFGNDPVRRPLSPDEDLQPSERGRSSGYSRMPANRV